MTQQEAIELEKSIEKSISDILKEDTMVSMTLSGKFKVTFNNNSFVFNSNNNVFWLNYCGSFDSLGRNIKLIKSYLVSNKKNIKKLMWSYTKPNINLSKQGDII